MLEALIKGPHQKEVVNFILHNKISFIGLVETKVKIMNFQKVTRRINKNWMWESNHSHHYNGRIIIGWEKSLWGIKVCSSSAQHLSCKVWCFWKRILVF